MSEQSSRRLLIKRAQQQMQSSVSVIVSKRVYQIEDPSEKRRPPTEPSHSYLSCLWCAICIANGWLQVTAQSQPHLPYCRDASRWAPCKVIRSPRILSHVFRTSTPLLCVILYARSPCLPATSRCPTGPSPVPLAMENHIGLRGPEQLAASPVGG